MDRVVSLNPVIAWLRRGLSCSYPQSDPICQVEQKSKNDIVDTWMKRLMIQINALGYQISTFSLQQQQQAVCSERRRRMITRYRILESHSSIGVTVSCTNVLTWNDNAHQY